MTDWLKKLSPSGKPEELTPLQLAWLGDAIWEVHQRLLLCSKPARLRDIHSSVVLKVKAEAQAHALQKLDCNLTDEEKQLVKRGRNRVGRGSRKIDAAIYAKATGFETLVGWLFLKNPKRLAQILDFLETSSNC